MAVNYIQLTGNLLQPEVRTTQTGKTVIKAQMTEILSLNLTNHKTVIVSDP